MIKRIRDWLNCDVRLMFGRGRAVINLFTTTRYNEKFCVPLRHDIV